MLFVVAKQTMLELGILISLIQFQSLFRKHYRRDVAIALQRKPTIKSVNTEYYREVSEGMVNMNHLSIPVSPSCHSNLMKIIIVVINRIRQRRVLIHYSKTVNRYYSHLKKHFSKDVQDEQAV